VSAERKRLSACPSIQMKAYGVAITVVGQEHLLMVVARLSISLEKARVSQAREGG